ncbi:MAG: shikimate kinase [Ruminococcaceae bacterium]|nr:shikimate kinase [Oscillospiraceae bacterium]
MEKKIYGLLGGRLAHSYSPEIHAAFGDYEYRLFEMPEEDVAPFLASDAFEAINVTIPYKKTVMPYLREISDEAKKIGSVNTITRLPDGGLRGDNTDYYGFSHMLDVAGIAVSGKKCLILGSGGASMTAIAVVGDRGGTPVVISRSGENNYENISRHADADVIINTTPVGMYPNNGESPVDLTIFPRLSGVVDMVYNPRRTALILQAQRLGIPALSGLSMLVAQGKRAAELFFSHPMDDALTEKAEKEVRARKENVILIGMPGCGKSTAGKVLAEKIGFDFADTDDEIQRMTGRHPAQIIREEGEEAFRRIEHEAVCSLGKLSSCVIATGGGVITRAENYDPLHQNGTIIYLTRPLAELATKDRPLTAANGVEALFAARHPLYTKWADAQAACSPDAAVTAEAIFRAAESVR